MKSSLPLQPDYSQDGPKLKLYVRNINSEFPRKIMKTNWWDGSWANARGPGSSEHEGNCPPLKTDFNLTDDQKKTIKIARRLRVRKESDSENLIYDHVTTGVFVADGKLVVMIENISLNKIDSKEVDLLTNLFKEFYQY